MLTIAPGIVETPMLATVSEDFRAGLAAGISFPQRLGHPDEYALLALSLIDHDYLNGEPSAWTAPSGWRHADAVHAADYQ